MHSSHLASEISAIEDFARKLREMIYKECNVQLSREDVLNAYTKARFEQSWEQFFALNYSPSKEQLHPLYKKLKGAKPAGINSLVTGRSGRGQNLWWSDLINSSIESPLSPDYAKNVVILDLDFFCWERSITSKQHTSINDIRNCAPLTLNKVTILNLYELCYSPNMKNLLRPISGYLKVILKDICDHKTLLILDSPHLLPEDLVEWALVEFKGKTKCSFSKLDSCKEVVRMGAEEMFNYNVNLSHSNAVTQNNVIYGVKFPR